MNGENVRNIGAEQSGDDHTVLIITGASGFIGRNLLEEFKDDYRIVALARRHQVECGAPTHPNITWHQVDIADREMLTRTFQKIRDLSGPFIVLHLAAYYDFTGKDHPEYWRTNVDGFKNLLEECADLDIRRLIFTSSQAACRFPSLGTAINELTPPDGEHVYAASKRKGEKLLLEYLETVPSCILRLPAMFSDWCEYPPLYIFLGTWLSNKLNRNILGGKGLSAIPYLHIRDGAAFFRSLINAIDVPAPCEVLLCGADGAITHRELFESAVEANDKGDRVPVLIPKFLCRIGLHAMNWGGALLHSPPFEQPWMADFIDKQLAINASRSRERLNWAPRSRYEIKRRMPFLIQNLKMQPDEWQRRNFAAMKKIQIDDNITLHRLLEKHRDRILQEFSRYLLTPEGRQRLPSYVSTSGDQQKWNATLLMRHLMNAVLTREKSVFTSYCKDVAEHRLEMGFSMQEVSEALNMVNQICLRVIREDPAAEDLDRTLHNCITLTFKFGIDQVMEIFERHTNQ